MNKIFLSFLLFSIISFLSCQKQNETSDLNLGFEKTTQDQKLPSSWHVGAVKDFSISIDTIVKHSGRNSLRIDCSEHSDSTSFGGVGMTILSTYEAKQIELRAYMKLKDVTKPIGLLLQLTGKPGVLQIDNMMERNITGTSDWTLYSVKLPYPDNTQAINFGVALQGTGHLWVDDMELLLDGKPITYAKLTK